MLKLYVGNLFNFVRLYFEAATIYHPARLTFLICYLGLDYLLQIYLPNANRIVFGCTSAYILLQSSIKSILTLPIRNTAVRLYRQIYLANLSADPQPDQNIGTTLAKFKRIADLFTSTERDLLNIIIYLPVWCTYLQYLLQNDTISWNIFIILINIFIFILGISIIQIRFTLFKAEEDMFRMTMQRFSNLRRHFAISPIYEDIQQILNRETNLYSKWMLYKHYYKILAVTPNIIYLVILFHINKLNTDFIIPFILLSIYWAKLTHAIIGLLGTTRGMPNITKPHHKHITHNLNNIQIVDLNYPNIFCNLSIDITFGSKIILSGTNGSGKTLLCNIIAGTIYDHLQYTKLLLPNNTMLLNPQNSIFASERQVMQANSEWQKIFGARYQYLLQQENLSQGQSNFLILTSVLLYNPKILILDETLESLDFNLLQTAIEFIKSLECTCIVVSHDPKIIRQFPIHMFIQGQNLQCALH